VDEPKLLRDGRYELLGLLGQGAQATTFAGFDRQRGQAVAIKRFDIRAASHWKEVELAEREVRILQSLNHRLIPRYVDHVHVSDEGALYLVMDRIHGETLEQRIRHHGPLSEREVWSFLADADRALTYLHSRPVPLVHRDIKPRNVIRTADGAHVFVDFGTVSEKLANRTQNGSTVAGTFGFMAPEQLHGQATPASDVFSVGMTALAMLTGQAPENLARDGLRVDVARILDRRVSPELICAIECMVQPEPHRRASSIREATGSNHDFAHRADREQPAPSTAMPIGQPAKAAREYPLLLWLGIHVAWVIAVNVPIALFVFGVLIPFFSSAVLFLLVAGLLIHQLLRPKANSRGAVDRQRSAARKASHLYAFARVAPLPSMRTRVATPQAAAATLGDDGEAHAERRYARGRDNEGDEPSIRKR